MIKSKKSTEVTAAYLKLTEHLVRRYGLSLSFLACSANRKPRTARAVSPPPNVYSPEMLLSPEQASEILGLSLATLANWRWLGTPYLPYKK